ncbi:MAG: two component transcriptional regulator, LuxR family [Massilia sp.]|nr:two component transcriptional regulator, LuxR family [Massilia sp.]
MLNPDCAGRTRLMCVDDHPVVRAGLAAILSNDPAIDLVAEASSGEEAIVEYRKHRPDVTLMDLRMPGMTGVEAIIAIRSHHPDARIVVLTTEAGDVQIRRALAAGARGYVLKGMSMAELRDTIKAVHAGKTRIPGNVAMHIAEHLADKNLSVREIEVVQMIASGRRNKQIAGDLLISEETIKMHVKNIMTKLNANDRTHAVTIAVQRGIIVLSEL